MEDHHHQNQHRRPYDLLPELRQFPTTGTTTLPYPPLPPYYPNLLLHSPSDPIQPPPPIYIEPFSVINNNNNNVGPDGIPFVVSSDVETTAPTYGQDRETNVVGFDLEGLVVGGGSGSGGSSRWPRQETLTLLEIRSRLANKFRETNHKAPLWDEVSRIMSEEHRYQRSGKKCREKFENLYKYYRKTKEGKAGRQDGKNYRFFRQLEAICGESSSHGNRDHHPNCYDDPPHLDLVNVYRFPSTCNNVEGENQGGRGEPPQYSPSFSDSMSVEYRQFDTSSEGEDDVCGEDKGELSAIALMMADNKKMRRSLEGQASKMSASSGSCERRKGWKEKVKKFVDIQVMRLVEKQDEWMDKMMSAMESNERERVRREIEWKEQESARFERERELWAKERAWMEARDSTFLDAMRNFSGKESANVGRVEDDLDEASLTEDVSSQRWEEHEILCFIQVMTSMEHRRHLGLEETTCSDDSFWELIEAKMDRLGYTRSSTDCRNKWNHIGNAFRKITNN